MPLSWFRAEQFRCLGAIELELDPGANVFIGPNASGKTSLLEAAFFLGRGRSFRSRRLDALIRHGQDAFVLAGRSSGGVVPVMLGVRARRDGTEWQAGGAPASGVAELAEQFPAQVIDPEIHKLLEEGPGRRRRFLDWGVFHVEPAFLPTWRRYHLALRQRNAALKQNRADSDLAAWEQELASSGEELVRQRERYLARLRDPLRSIGEALLGSPITLVHNQGWDEKRPLLEALEADRGRDRRYRATQSGPHRGDATVEVGGRAAKDRVSRGQQKLVAAGLILAQLGIQEQERPGRSALLLDDPAAELDPENLARLMAVVRTMPAQLWVTALRGDIPGLPARGRMFHVEQGTIRPS
ncbi:MAG: DNA replication/repair protein RecF [Steroidobacteraceae bacterium]